jgi:hypothetical protein
MALNIDTTHKPSDNFEHVEHTLEPVYEEIDSEALRRSKRHKTTKSFGDDFIVYLVDDNPKTISETFASLNAGDWKEVVRSEIDSILSNKTLELADSRYPADRVPLHTSFKSRQGAEHTPMHRHVPCSTGPCLPTEVGFGAATCPVALDPTSLIGRAPVPSRVS